MCARVIDMMRTPVPQDEHVLGFAQIKAANMTDQQVADGKIEQTP